MRWRHLCSRPRIWCTESPILDAAARSQLIKACTPVIEAQQPSPSYAALVDYRSVPLAACGAAAKQAARAAIVAAAHATGIPARGDDDVMVARTASVPGATAETLPGAAVLNMHHDRHKSESRIATFMLYLTTIDAAHGGETFFPAAGTTDDDPIAASLRRSYAAGVRLLPRDAEVMAACEQRLHEWRRVGRDSDSCAGRGSVALAGRAILFDAAGEGADAGAWHAPCAVRGPTSKWTLTFFKEPAPLWGATNSPLFG